MTPKNITGTLRRLYTGLTIMVILVFVGFFYYHYISDKEQKLKERNFRVLQRIEKNLEARILDTRELVINKIRDAETKHQGNKNTKIAIDSVLKQISENDGTYTQEDGAMGFDSSADWKIIGNGKNSRIYFYILRKELGGTAKPGLYTVSGDVETIVSRVLRHDVFSSYILNSHKGIAYNNCQDVCVIPISDSILRNDGLSELKIGTGNFYVFSHPFSHGADQQLVLSGLMTAKEYAHEKFSVPDSFLLIIFLLFLIILLSFPFIKSFLVSKEETLDTGDVLLALLSLFLLCYMYTFIHVSTYSRARDKKLKEEMLMTTADSIQNAFLAELSNMQLQLKSHDSIFSALPQKLRGTPLRIDTSFEPKFYHTFKRIFWVNNKGDEIAEIDTANKLDSNRQNFSDRDYFKAAKNKELWYPENVSHDKIYLEPVYSRNYGISLAAISKPGQTSAVAVMSTEMRSVMNTVQPKELNFCLVNKKGDILFTSLGNEHIHENLAEELNPGDELSSAVYNRSSTFFSGDFMGSNSTFYIRPVNNLPLYVVTFYNKEPAGEMQLQVCLFTSLFILIILVLFSLAILFILFLKAQRTNNIVKQPFLDLSILYPRSIYLYRDFGSIFFNLILAGGLLICAFICRNQPFIMVALFFINAFYTTVAFCYARVHLQPLRRKLFWVVISFLLIVSDALLFKSVSSKLPLISLLGYELLLLFVIWQLRKLSGYEKHNNGSPVPPPAEKTDNNKLQKFIKAFQQKLHLKFYHQFALMLVSWFSLIALLPLVFAYNYLYKNEAENYIKATQIDIAQQLYDKSAYKKEITAVLASPGKLYLQGFYQTTVSTAIPCENARPEQEDRVDNFLNNFRFAVKSKYFRAHTTSNGKRDTTTQFCKNQGKLFLGYQNLLNHTQPPYQNTVYLQSTVPGFLKPWCVGKVGFVIYFIVLPLLFLTILFGIIWFFLKRFFLFEVLPQKQADNTQLFTKLFNQYRQNKEKGNPPFRLFINGVASSGKIKLISQAVGFIYAQTKEHINDETKSAEKVFISSHLFVYDLAEIDQSIMAFNMKKHTKGEVIFLKHFEHNLAEKEMDEKKFNFISSIFQMGADSPHLVISSNIPPSLFLSSLKSKANIDSFKTEDYIFSREYYNWTGLLSGFEVFTKAYEDTSASTSAGSLTAYDAYKSKYTFYSSIWNSLDRIEKFVLYDLAKDDLVNYRNREVVYSLYRKGLVVQHDMPQIVNEELRNFIISEISEEDVELEKRQSGTGNTWNRFKIPFLIMLLAVLLFVFITQQETFNKLMAGLIAVAGGLPILMKLFQSSENKKS